jgi:hypothetical protein
MLTRMIKKGILILIKIYQLALSPDQGIFGGRRKPACRFFPTCSVYAGEAVERYGVSRGLRLAAKRIMRCHPWGPAGYDPLN